MDATQKLVEKLVERRMQNTGESQAVATANALAAFEKLKKEKDWPEPPQALVTDLAEASGLGTRGQLVRYEHQLIAAIATNLPTFQLSFGKAAF